MSVKKIVNRIGESFWQIPLLSRKIELAYQASVKKHLDKLPLLSTPDLVLLETLRSEGIVVTSLSALSLPLTLQMLQVAKSLIAEIPHSISGNKNEFVIHATSKQIIEHSEIFYWGLQQRLLDIIENYLCLPVAYHHPSFRRDIANDVKLKTRLWHLDKEDRKTIKICIYLNDVNDDGGPFEYIPQSFTSTVADSLKYNYGYIPDQTMQRAGQTHLNIVHIY
ncbi:MAG: 2OG-Fe(II) oxygenase [Komarekiella atlantica HA4396-MV6]|jgi:hypothetical protein|nr:2OG-Fe(II) oxygenase [Komarekiella atlantica HA4396-MV6]